MTYLKLIWKMNFGFIIFSMVFISLFQLMILYLVTTFDTQAILNSMLNQMPEPLKVFLNDSFFNMLTFDGAAAFGFNHPIVLALLATVAITIPVKHISREIENGNMELMLSLPFRRKSLVWNLWLASSLILGLIIFISMLGSLLSISLFHELSWKVTCKMLAISFNAWLLFVVIMSISLYITTISKGGGFSGNLSASVIFLFYMLFFIGQLWDVLKPTLPYTIFYYYQPQLVMFGKGDFVTDILVLSGLSLILLFASIYRFERRDIP